MNRKDYEYKIGSNAPGLIPALIMLIIFGGVTAYLYVKDNSAVIFTGGFAALLFIACAFSVYKTITTRILVYRDGIYYRSRLGGGRFYKYTEIKKAWHSLPREEEEIYFPEEDSGRPEEGEPEGVTDTAGAVTDYCFFKTHKGETVRFFFYPADIEAVEYFIERVETANFVVTEEKYSEDRDEYLVDGKIYGRFSIVLSLIIAAVILLSEAVFLRFTERLDVISAFLSVSVAVGAVITVIYMICRYFCYKVVIKRDGFFLQTAPFNGRDYDYRDIAACREVRYRPNSARRSGGLRYRDCFVFKEKNGKIRRLIFQRELHGHEFRVLAERINSANGYDGSESRDLGALKRLGKGYIALRIALAAALFACVFYMMKNSIPVPSISNPFRGSLQESVLPEIPKPDGGASEKKEVPDRDDVYELLNSRGFETADMPTTYWFIDEESLMFVSAGEKDGTKFEFYQYTSSFDSCDLVFNRISYDISQDLEPRERDELVREIDGGRFFEFTENGVQKITLYKGNTVVYAYQPESSGEIQELLAELGYIR